MQIQPIVIGTAGHIDHGKSTLVRVLTGIDPDRLAEEKERGMTIDLGFARFDLPDGRCVGIVDVPGHERFVRNMVAGATGIDLVLLVVAADDGVMPQTREHLSIMRVLGVMRGLVVLTKIDMVDEEMRMLAEDDVRTAVAGSFLEGAPIVHVSSTSGEGIEALKALIVELAAGMEPRTAEGIFRLPIQRVFSARGFGTVVTGIPVSGTARIGDVLEVLPAGKKGKVRSIQAYHEGSDTARAGHSSALALADIDLADVQRGDVVATPGFFQAQKMVGASVEALDSALRPISNRMRVRVHTGTSDALGEVILLDADELAPGQVGLVQFRMEEPLVCAPGDRFVLRLASPVETLGGGVILEESRYRLKRFKTFVLDELSRQAQSLGSPEALLESILARAPERWLSIDDLARAVKRERVEVQRMLEGLQAAGKAAPLGPQPRWIHAATLELAIAEQRDVIEGWFAANPLRARMDLRDVRAGLSMDPNLVGMLLEREAAAGRLVLEAGGKLGLAGREVTLDEGTRKLVDGLTQALVEARLAPPSPDELAEALRAPRAEIDRCLRLLVDTGEVVHVGGELFASAVAIEAGKAAVIANCEKNGGLEIPELRDALDTTRKFLIPMLEYFDAQGVTQRKAGRRVLKRK
ncbi:MAG: selenocysteine-specific translation elongation factor [Planctomycetota bacterium]